MGEVLSCCPNKTPSMDVIFELIPIMGEVLSCLPNKSPSMDASSYVIFELDLVPREWAWT